MDDEREPRRGEVTCGCGGRDGGHLVGVDGSGYCAGVAGGEPRGDEGERG